MLGVVWAAPVNWVAQMADPKVDACGQTGDQSNLCSWVYDVTNNETATTIALLKGAAAGVRWLDDLGLPNLRMDDSGHLSGTLAAAERDAA